MYNTIVNPITGRAVNVNGRTGKMILKQYVDQLEAGGKEGKEGRSRQHDAWRATGKGGRDAPRQPPLFTFGQAQQPRPGTAPYRRPDWTLPTSAGAASVTAAWDEMTRPELGQWERLGPGAVVQVVRTAGTTAGATRQARRHFVGDNKGSIQFDDPPHELPLYQLEHHRADVPLELESAHAKLYNFVERGPIGGLTLLGKATQDCPDCAPSTPCAGASFTKCARNAYALQGDINTLVKYYIKNAAFEKKFAHRDGAREAQGLTAHSNYWATFPNIISASGPSSAAEEKLRAWSRKQEGALRSGERGGRAMGEHFQKYDDGVGGIFGAELRPGQYRQ